MVDIEELQNKREKYLLKLYELADGYELTHVLRGDVEKELGLDPNEASKIQVYLMHSGFIDMTTTSISISHYGINEAERLLRTLQI